ncbi:response regulator [Symbiobacterium thermophilum]|jgi:DNA-binding NarL/FixJ family response regulator|uniref:Stage 0 sporulation protein A homolog n=3 Tax=Symbiobacterium thermophilum TaxID=2734 RepID=Q67QY5_SYMTH|nr:response regulator transcription factor [Symbiobacterium thermophilum]MBY6274996.1 DNA-binding response regulator [Symbiobacterium thermophilum]BAD39908.1 two-component response regulator [Symbiobacterium thermophilum IAM 14863]
MKVLIVDDHLMLRKGVLSVLSNTDLEVIGEASNGQEALELVPKLKPDLVLMDINMPVLDGVEATRKLKQMYPDLKVVILTVSEIDKDLFEAIKAGADGYLLKNLGPEELVSSLRAAISGEAPISSVMAAKMLKEFRQPRANTTGKQPGQQLSPREIEVLRLASTGLTYKEIAAKLYVAESTVKNHMRHILEKLHLRNRSEAVGYAIRTGLAGEPPSNR